MCTFDGWSNPAAPRTHSASRDDWRDGGTASQPTLDYIGATKGYYKAPRWSDQASFDTMTESDERESVYIIHSPATKSVKIGRSKQVFKRFSALRTASPDALELLAIYSDESELNLHRRFSDRRKHGEWFDDSILVDLGLVEGPPRAETCLPPEIVLSVAPMPKQLPAQFRT